MKNTPPNSHNADQPDDLLPEYTFDYSRSRPNRFATNALQGRRWVMLDADIAAIFKTPESVNHVLRALIEHMPNSAKHE